MHNTTSNQTFNELVLFAKESDFVVQLLCDKQKYIGAIY